MKVNVKIGLFGVTFCLKKYTVIIIDGNCTRFKVELIRFKIEFGRIWDWVLELMDNFLLNWCSSAHIPKAVFLNTMECTNATKMYPRAVPNKECFADYAGSLGISNKHHLIVYDRSPFGFYASSRMWWIFRVRKFTSRSILCF